MISCQPIQNDEVLLALLDVNWYLLPKEQKVAYQITLINALNPIILTIGGLSEWPFSLATFDKVCF